MSHYVVESSRLFIGTTQKRGKEGAVVNILNSNSMLMLQRSMGFLWSKQDCILNNLANAETPGYKTQYVTFEESLRMRSRPRRTSPSRAPPCVRQLQTPRYSFTRRRRASGWTTMGWILWSSRWSWREMAISSSMS